MHYKAAWACGQAALRLAHMPTRRYDHHRLSPLVSTRNDEGPKVAALAGTVLALGLTYWLMRERDDRKSE